MLMKHVVRSVNSQAQAMIELLRPFTLLAPLIVSSCVIIASFFYTNSNALTLNGFLYMVLPASLCFALLNGASNTLNQATDYTEDIISKPYRPIPRGIISRRQAFFLAVLLYASTFLVSLCIHEMFTLIITLIMVFSITYSLFPRMKQFLFFNQLWVAIPRGFLAILGSWSVFGNPFDHIPIVMGFIAALFLFGGTTTKDILDAEADKKAGTHTLVNVYGVSQAAKISAVFMVSAFLLILPLVVFHIIDGYFLFLSFLVVCSVVISYQMTHSHRNDKYENTSAWTLMYGTYFLFALSFAFLVISCA
ncbi:MAG: UbiA family prenyltransferase [Candidatus Thermoplasmatota archaeon]|nr:UbiA family prenyltransferase [Candidatus Thermoplasmatota archaeon]